MEISKEHLINSTNNIEQRWENAANRETAIGLNWEKLRPIFSRNCLTNGGNVKEDRQNGMQSKRQRNHTVKKRPDDH